MPRREFSKAVRVAAIKRAAGLCEAPGCGLPHLGRFEIDHVIADGLLGKPVLENAMLMCVACHKLKTKKDVRDIAQAKAREASHIGARQRPKQQIRSAGFPASGRRAAHPMPSLPTPLRRGVGMSTLSRIPGRLDARQDPAHRLWFIWLDAVEAMRADPCADTVEAVDAAWRAFLADFTRPASAERGVAA